MKIRIFLIAVLLNHSVLCQIDNVGSGRAMKFDGINDYVELGNIYDDLTYPFSVSVWVYLDEASAGGPIIISQDNADLYNGFWFFVYKTSILFEYGDGLGNNHPVYRRGKVATISDIANRWTHVAAVALAKDNIVIYVNGYNVGGSVSGASSNPMASQFPNDVARIGYHVSNGVHYRFKGMMDELCVYNKTLTQAEITSAMCKKNNASTTGLIGYWNFNETSGNTLFDLSSKDYHGVCYGNPERLYSGAPIGDESVQVYPLSWSGVLLTKDAITAKNVQGNPWGLHIYKVNDSPSQTGGLPGTLKTNPYYGVFLAANGSGPRFDLENSCQRYQRKDNSIAAWGLSTSSTSIVDRMEGILLDEKDFQVNLGPDESLCSFQPRTLIPVNDPDGLGFLWQDGSTQSTLTATNPGTYWVNVTGNCRTIRDTVTFTVTPPIVASLGNDEVSCSFQPTLLRPVASPIGLTFLWQDGTNAPTFIAKNFGTYSVTISSQCETVTRSVTYSQVDGLEVDLGPDRLVCPFEPTLLVPVQSGENLTFKWQDGSTTPTFEAKTYGRYWVSVSNQCQTVTDSIVFTKKPPTEFIPNVITPNNDEFNDSFIVDVPGPLELAIYNRWGRPVYYSSNYDSRWNAHDLVSGVYYYIMTGECLGEKKGVIQVIK